MFPKALIDHLNRYRRLAPKPPVYGMSVELTHTLRAHPRTETLRNVTEVHYCYEHPLGWKKVAFESDVHRTGVTYMCDQVLEFEVRPETEIADAF